MASVQYTYMKPLVNSYVQKLVQTKWDVAVHGRYFYLVKPTLGPPRKFQHLTRAQEVVITRLRITHTKATKSHTLSRGPPNGCHHCGQTLTIDYLTTDHMLLEFERHGRDIYSRLRMPYRVGRRGMCLKTVQDGPQSHLSGCTLEVGWGPRHTLDAVRVHYSLQAGL